MTTGQIGRARDAVDRQLLGLLQGNARLSLTELSRAVGRSRTAVQARVSRLEREKVILGYEAVVRDEPDAPALGAVLSIVFSQHPCRPVAEKFRRWPQIVDYYSVTGPVDAFAVVKVRDSLELSQLIYRLSGLPGVASVGSAVMLREDFD
jgi:DNA-binding Lrp family transcriptional regulator